MPAPGAVLLLLPSCAPLAPRPRSRACALPSKTCQRVCALWSAPALPCALPVHLCLCSGPCQCDCACAYSGVRAQAGPVPRRARPGLVGRVQAWPQGKDRTGQGSGQAQGSFFFFFFFNFFKFEKNYEGILFT